MSLINITLIVYVIAFIAYIVREIWRSTPAKWVSLGLLILAFCFNLAMVAKRSIEAGHPPFSNLYESLIFYACCTAFVYIIFEFVYNFKVVGALASVLSMLILLYATLQDDTIRPIMPALKSNWMLVHVVTYMLGYAAFGISFVTSIIFLVVKPFLNKQRFKNPVSGQIKDISLSGLWVLIFGPVYFVFNGIWLHAIIVFIANMLVGFSNIILIYSLGSIGYFFGTIIFLIFGLIYPLCASGIMRNHYLKNRWVEINKES